MRWYSKMAVCACALPLALSCGVMRAGAQETPGAIDFRGRPGYSAEELAQALFAEPTSPVRTRGVGPAQTLPSLPVPRPAVTLNVFFTPNSETIPSMSYAEIDKLGTVLSWPQYTEYRVQLEGHTDNQGSERKNQLLSEKRVQTIKAYLLQRYRIAPERVRAVGYGASKPIAPNDTPDGRSQNRRVEVVNLGRGQ